MIGARFFLFVPFCFVFFLFFWVSVKEGRAEGRKEGTKEGWKDGRKEASKQGRKEEPSPNLHVFWSQIENQVDMNPK